MVASATFIGGSKGDGSETNASTSITVGAGAVPPDGASILQLWFGGETIFALLAALFGFA